MSGMLIHAALLAGAAKVEPISDRPLEVPRSASVSWLKQVCPAEHLESWIEASLACESPIEVIMFLGLCAAFSAAKFPSIVMPANSCYAASKIADREVSVHIFLQEPVKGYRIDVSAHISASVEGKTYRRAVAVECDGLDFHSSDFQVDRDKAKDAVLRKKGFRVYRFSGSEIWSNAQELCEAVVTPVLLKCIRLAKKGHP